MASTDIIQTIDVIKQSYLQSSHSLRNKRKEQKQHIIPPKPVLKQESCSNKEIFFK